MCFVKLVGGRRITDKHIQRTMPVESKGDCELYCQYEKEFHCEGFNFRFVIFQHFSRLYTILGPVDISQSVYMYTHFSLENMIKLIF